MRADSVREWVALAIKMIRGKHGGDERVLMFEDRRMELAADRPVPLELDGEVLDPSEEAIFEIEPGAMTVCVPRARVDSNVNSSTNSASGDAGTKGG